MTRDVAIVGGGLAGLTCARHLTAAGLEVRVFEAEERVGGRIVTDRVEGFLLDRGFQVLLDSYPAARRELDLEALRPGAFTSGALVQKGASRHRIADPWRTPLQGLATLRAPFVKFSDALALAHLRSIALEPRDDDPREANAMLSAHGFSPELLASFFRPFFGGVTLDASLSVPAWYFLDLFGWFAKGSAVLPADGMQALPEQLAAGLPDSCVQLGARVRSVTADEVVLESQDRVACRAVVVAADARGAERLLGRAASREWLGTTTVYYACDESPLGEPVLLLDGDGEGPVNHLCVPSDAQPTYAPEGAALLSASVLGVPPQDDEALDRAIRAQLGRLFEDRDVQGWRWLRTDRIPDALPRLAAGPRPRAASTPADGGPFVAGDHVSTPSIQGTLASGAAVARAVLEALGAPAGSR